MKTERHLIKFVPLVGILMLLMNCGSGGDQSAAPEDLSSVKQQVSEHDTQLARYSEQSDSLQQKVAQLRETINALEQSNTELKSMLAEREGQKFDLDNEQAIADKIIQLENRLSMLEDRVDFIDSTKFDMLTRFEKIESKLGTAPGKQDIPATHTKSAPAKASRSANKLSKEAYRSQYQNAYEVYSKKNYEQAIKLFTDLIERNPEGDLSDNAQYWIGECYYGLKNYTRAIVEFEKVFTFKESNKDDDAQLKLGLCYLNLGQRDKAREEFQRLVDFYPESDYKAKAIEYLRQL